MSKLQRGDVPAAALEQLALDKMPDGVEVDAGTLHLVHQIPGAVVPFLTFDLVDINGTTVTRSDVQAQSEIPGVATPGLDRLRYIQQCVVETDALVGPILTRLWHRWRGSFAGGAMSARLSLAVDVPVRLGPFYIPAGMQHVVQTYTNGGIGEFRYIYRIGWSAPAGGAVPLVAGVEQT